MQEYQDININVLVDKLAKHTEEYTKMLFNNDKGEAFDLCEKTIFNLQAAINARLSKDNNTSITDGIISFTDKDEDTTS